MAVTESGAVFVPTLPTGCCMAVLQSVKIIRQLPRLLGHGVPKRGRISAQCRPTPRPDKDHHTAGAAQADRSVHAPNSVRGVPPRVKADTVTTPGSLGRSAHSATRWTAAAREARRGAARRHDGYWVRRSTRRLLLAGAHARMPWPDCSGLLFLFGHVAGFQLTALSPYLRRLPGGLEVAVLSRSMRTPIWANSICAR
jgi:hypothetical protein